MADDANANAALASVRASAHTRLSALLNAPETPASSPPAPEVPPAPAAATPAAPAPPSQPAAPSPASPGGAPTAEGSPPSGQPTAPTTIDPSALSDKARRFLEMKGGSVERALADALDQNNRLAELSRDPAASAAPAAPAGQPAETAAAPTSTPPAPEVPPLDAPIELDLAAIEEETNRRVDSDPDLAALSTRYDKGIDRLHLIAGKDGESGKLSEVAREIDRLEYRLTLPETDEFTKDGVRQQIRDKKLEQQELKAERRDLLADQKEIKGLYRERSDAYRQRVASEHHGRAKSERQRAAHAAAIEHHTQALKAGWQPAIARAMTKHNIPETLTESFGKRARTQALANLEQGITVDEIDPFMDGIATGLVADLVTFHREQAAIHGRQAQERHLQSAPTTPAAAPTPESGAAPPRAPSQAGLMKGVYAQARARLHAGMTGQR